MPVITSSNKLRTYTSARYYTDDEILEQITKPGKPGKADSKDIILNNVKKAVSAPRFLMNPKIRRKGGK